MGGGGRGGSSSSCMVIPTIVFFDSSSFETSLEVSGDPFSKEGLDILFSLERSLLA